MLLNSTILYMEITNEIKGLWKGFLRKLGGNGWGRALSSENTYRCVRFAWLLKMPTGRLESWLPSRYLMEKQQ